MTAGSGRAGRAVRTVRSGTRDQLLLRQGVLLALFVLSVATLAAAHHGSHRNFDSVRNRTKVAMVEVATAHRALDASYATASKSLTTQAAPLVGPGGDYSKEVALATQSLTKAAEANVTGEPGRRSLKTVTGLVGRYTDFVQHAARQEGPEAQEGREEGERREGQESQENRENRESTESGESQEDRESGGSGENRESGGSGEGLREVYLSYAGDVLKAPGAGIQPRLAALQREQQRVLDRQVSFGWVLRTAWAAAALAALALLAALVETQVLLRRRFHRKYNRGLAVVTLFVLIGWGAAVGALVAAQADLNTARRLLAGTSLPRYGTGEGTGTRPSTGAGPTGTGDSTRIATEVDAVMDTTIDKADLTAAVPLAGLLLAGLALLALHHRIREYHYETPLTINLNFHLNLKLSRNRWAVIGLALPLTATATVAGGEAVGRVGYKDTVTVIASWTGDEAKAFETLLDSFTEATGYRVDFQGTTAVRQVLQSEVESGTPPDVAILPAPGDLAEYAANGTLKALDPELAKAYGMPWTPRTGAGEKAAVHWVPVKADLKSIVWYDTRRFRSRGGAALSAARHIKDIGRAVEPDGGTNPSGNRSRSRDRGGETTAWCLGMADEAASGWPGTDWVEDILLQQQGPRTYERWAAGELAWTDPVVEQAWRTWAELLAPDLREQGYAGKALKRGFGDAGSAGLFGESPDDAGCLAEHQASFIRGTYGAKRWRRAAFAPSAEFFGIRAGGNRAWQVSGDSAALFRDSEGARALVRHLASERTQLRWGTHAPEGQPPSFSAHRGLTVQRTADGVSRQIAARLRNAEPMCLDASDVMPPAMREAFVRAVPAFLQDPSDPGRLDELMEQLDAARLTAKANDHWLRQVCG